MEREKSNSSHRVPKVGASGIGCGTRGEISSEDYGAHRNFTANHGIELSQVPAMLGFTQDEYEAAQTMMMLSRDPVEEDGHSAEIVQLSPNSISTDASLQVAPPVKLSFVNQIAEISLPPRKVIDKRRAQNATQSPRYGGKIPHAVAPASTVQVRNTARLQRSGSQEQNTVEHAATSRSATRSRTNYPPVGEREDRPSQIH